MPGIAIEGLDASIVESLERRAASAGRDVADEARLIIERALRSSPEGRTAVLREAMASRQPKGGGLFGDSALLLRQTRDGKAGGEGG